MGLLAPTTRDWVALAMVYGVGLLLVGLGIGLISKGGSEAVTGLIVLAHSFPVFPQTRRYIIALGEYLMT